MKNYSDETIKQCIASLLVKLDEIHGEGMHWRGQTPDWFVAAAMVSCDIEDNAGEVARYYAKEVSENEAIHRRIG